MSTDDDAMFWTLEDFEAAAKEVVPSLLYKRLFGTVQDWAGRNNEHNIAAFRRIKLRQRVLNSVSARRLSVEAIGNSIDLPVILAPVAQQMRFHPTGEVATVRAAGVGRTIMVLSTDSNCTLEEVAAAATGPLWFEVYYFKDKALTEMLVKRAEAAGYAAIVLTVDTIRVSQERPAPATGVLIPTARRVSNLINDDYARQVLDLNEDTVFHGWPWRQWLADDLHWSDVEWLQSITSLPLIIKGIQTAADARRCREIGIAGVVVSNHAGKTLPDATATIDQLPEVVAAVEDSCEVFIDSGVRSGADVLKAMAMGARAVLIGTPMIWGLAVNGEAGVVKVLDILRRELDFAMATCCVADIRAVDRDLVSMPS